MFEVGAMESSMWRFRVAVGDTKVQWVHCWHNMRIYVTVGASWLLLGDWECFEFGWDRAEGLKGESGRSEASHWIFVIMIEFFDDGADIFVLS